MDEYAKNGYRIIAISMSHNEEFNNLTLIGFILLKDNIRKEAYEGIRQIKSAGIDVVMVTGDSTNTAVSVAKEVYLKTNTD